MCSSPPVSGAPSALRRPMTFSCLVSGCFSQSSSSMRMRRTTAYEPPRIQAYGPLAASRPTKIRSSKSGSAGLGLLVPSTWPIRLRAVIGSAVAPGVRLKPFICHRSRAVSPASFWRARSAWKATSASSEPIWTHRSPLLRPASSTSAEKSGSGPSWTGRRAVSCVRSKKVRPKPKVTVSEDGPASSATPVSAAGVRPAISSSAVRDQRRSSAAASLRPVPGARSNATRWPRAWRGVVMPACCLARSSRKATAVEPTLLSAAGGSSWAAATPIAPPAAPTTRPAAPAAPTVPSRRRRESSRGSGRPSAPEVSSEGEAVVVIS